MTRALIFEPSYLRIKSRIDSISGIEMTVMTPDRKFLIGGREVDIKEVPPEIGWLNFDLFQNRAIGGYIGARSAKKVNPSYIRKFIIVTSVLITIVFFLRRH